MTLSPDTRLGRYRIVEPLGKGGMARVYKAFDPQFERFVAIKVLSADLVHDPQFRARFDREIKTLASLDHPNVAQVHDSGQDGDAFYMVLQYFANQDLKTRMTRPITTDVIFGIIEDTARALAAAHRMGIIHRDLKPANILLAEDGRAVLADFGVAKIVQAHAVTDSLTVSGIGTPHYMSPEQVGGKQVTARSDVYSFGVLMFQLLTGRLPFDAETPVAIAVMHLKDPFPLPRQLRPDLPREVEKFILKCTAKEPGERYPDGEALLRALEKLPRKWKGSTASIRLDDLLSPAAAEPVAAPKEDRTVPMARPAEPVVDRSARRPMRWIAAGVLIALAAGLGFLAMSRKEPKPAGVPELKSDGAVAGLGASPGGGPAASSPASMDSALEGGRPGSSRMSADSGGASTSPARDKTPPRSVPDEHYSEREKTKSVEPAESRTVESTPPGPPTALSPGFLAVHVNGPAAIYVDGELKLAAATAGRFELNPGKHVVRLEMEGLPAKQWEVEIVSGAESSLSHDFALDATGGIRVVSGGIWAWVLLDGKNTGKTTPVLLEGVRAGRHRIALVREGFVVEGGVEQVIVQAGKTVDMNFSGKVRPK